MNRVRSLTVAAVLTSVLAGAAVHAQGPGPGGRRGPGGPGAFGRGGGLPLRALNLSEAQQEQIRTLTEQRRTENQSAAERFRGAMDAQRKALAAIPFNEQLIRSTTQELAEAQTEMAIQQARLRTEIFNLLTPEQQAEARKLQAEREAQARQRESRRQQPR